jgi:N-acetylglucosamine kinase
MTAAGIDLGGTKIATQLFDASWRLVEQRRTATPADYPGLLDALADHVAWAEARLGPAAPIGLASAGLVNPATGLALTANLPSTGRPFPADLTSRTGRHVELVNDCRAFALSEAVFGAARGMNPAIGLILGTGLGGGIILDGKLVPGFAAVGGEFGHFGLAAAPMLSHGLPVLRCGCGRLGCTETYLSGPGLARIAAHQGRPDLSARQIAEGRCGDPALQQAWAIWIDLLAEALVTLCLTVDPACIVLGGGVSAAPGLVADLTLALQGAQLKGFAVPQIRLAEGGDASGARGAAYAAHLARGDGA